MKEDMGDPIVNILLSTYNGERYVSQQVESLLNQTYKNIFIKVRDDGSIDNTVDIISQYISTGNNIEIVKGSNLGVVGSFFDLLYSVGENVEFVAFCDQDDFWHENKIEVAIKKLKVFGKNIPTMYCGATRRVDKYLNVIDCSKAPRKPLKTNNSLIENVATGCTIVLNRKAIDLIISKKPNNDSVLMHDYWIYLIVSSFGKVFYDDVPYIDYRQHDNNVVGSQKGIDLWYKRFKRFATGNDQSLSKQAHEFYVLYGDQLPEEQKKLVLSFLNIACSTSFLKRLVHGFNFPVYRQTSLETFLSKLMLVMGRYK